MDVMWLSRLLGVVNGSEKVHNDVYVVKTHKWLNPENDVSAVWLCLGPSYIAGILVAAEDAAAPAEGHETRPCGWARDRDS